MLQENSAGAKASKGGVGSTRPAATCTVCATNTGTGPKQRPRTPRQQSTEAFFADSQLHSHTALSSHPHVVPAACPHSACLPRPAAWPPSTWAAAAKAQRSTNKTWHNRAVEHQYDVHAITTCSCFTTEAKHTPSENQVSHADMPEMLLSSPPELFRAQDHGSQVVHVAGIKAR